MQLLNTQLFRFRTCSTPWGRFGCHTSTNAPGKGRQPPTQILGFLPKAKNLSFENMEESSTQSQQHCCSKHALGSQQNMIDRAGLVLCWRHSTGPGGFSKSRASLSLPPTPRRHSRGPGGISFVQGVRQVCLQTSQQLFQQRHIRLDDAEVRNQDQLRTLARPQNYGAQWMLCLLYIKMYNLNRYMQYLLPTPRVKKS